MTATYTANTKLVKPAYNDLGWDQTIRDNYDTLDALNALGDLAVTMKEIPSSSLNVKVAAGAYVAQDGTVATFAGSTSTAIAASTTKVLYLDLTAGGALVVGAAYPTTPHVRLATVIAGPAAITSISDDRLAYRVCGGTIGDGINMTFGTVTGTKIGTATTQKLGFFNATPIVRPTLAAFTFGATYTAAEQAAVQNLYNAIRALGLGG